MVVDLKRNYVFVFGNNSINNVQERVINKVSSIWFVPNGNSILAMVGNSYLSDNWYFIIQLLIRIMPDLYYSINALSAYSGLFNQR